MAVNGSQTAPRLSIVCCVRDGAAHLPALLDDLGGARTEEDEVVLLDDGSEDGTGALLEAWAATEPRTVVLRTTVSAGVGHAQIRAVAAARGDYVWIVDGDDRIPADGARTLLDAAVAADADVVVARAESLDVRTGERRLVDAHGGAAILDGADAFRLMLLGSVEGYTWSKVFRRRLFDGAALPPLTTQSDFCRVALGLARAERVVVLGDVVYTYLRRGSSVMDRSDPPIENLEATRAWITALAHRTLAGTPADRAALDVFTVRACAAAAVQVPIYVGASGSVRSAGRRIARRAVRPVRLLRLLRADRVAGIEAVLLRVSPRLYSAAFRSKLAMQALRRTAG